jgi:hypothetical protein
LRISEELVGAVILMEGASVEPVEVTVFWLAVSSAMAGTAMAKIMTMTVIRDIIFFMSIVLLDIDRNREWISVFYGALL